jgi:mannose-6-phosphate isomerase
MRPVVMPPNRLAHFYLGGEAITRLRGVPAPAERSPEEWLASTVTRFGEQSTGLSTLPDGGLLLDAVREDPEGWTGGAMPAGPGDVGVLVKLLDAGQRLPVHVHPDRPFAARHLHSCYGKTEAWVVLEAVEGAQVHVGWREDVDPEELARAVLARDPAWMLERMNAVDVVAGDVVLVPGGTAHAIGAGIFVVEVQEPSDYSVLLEFEGFASLDDAFVGLDVTGGVASTTTAATGPEELRSLCRHVELDSRDASPQRLLPERADEFFRADLLAPAGTPVAVEAGFGVLVVLAGTGTLRCGDGEVAVAGGDVVAVPHGAGRCHLDGDVSAVLCRPAGEEMRGTGA